jgi:hypothetical protein
MSGRQWVLEHFDRPTPMNKYRTEHWAPRSKDDAYWRQTFGWLARQQRIPALQAVVVTVAQACRPGKDLPDVGGCFPAAKAAIDGLVDARVLPDDSPEFVRALTFVAPEYGERDRFVLIIEEAPTCS